MIVDYWQIKIKVKKLTIPEKGKIPHIEVYSNR